MTTKPTPSKPLTFYSEKKILHLCAVDFTARHFLAPVAFDQQRLGAEVGIICCTGPDFDALNERGMRMIPLAIPRSLNPIKLLREGLKLWNILRREKPDVLHVHTPIASILGRVVGKVCGVKTIVYTVHGFTFHEHSREVSWWMHFAVEKVCSLFHDAMICVSLEDAKTAKRKSFYAPRGIFFIPNGVEPERYTPLKEEALASLKEDLCLQPNQQVVAFFGRINQEKGTREFVEAAIQICREFDDAVALLVGPTLSSEREQVLEELQWMIAENDLKERIRFIGYRHDVPSLLQLCKVFCLPSWREGFPVTVLEAMMSGRPIVATTIRGIREMIRDEEEGLLVPIKDSEALADAISHLLRDEAFATKLGQRAHKRAESLYTLKHQLKRTHAAYKKILGAVR